MNKGKLVSLAIALAMGVAGWYGLSHKRPAKVGEPCGASQEVRQAADGSMVVCSQDMGWKPAR